MFVRSDFLTTEAYVSIVFIYSTEVSEFLILLSFHYIILRHYLLKQIRQLEIKTSIVSNLDFPNNTISLCFFFFFLIIDSHYFIPGMIAQSFSPTAELVIPTSTQTNKANTEIERQPVTVETKISKFSR